MKKHYPTNFRTLFLSLFLLITGSFQVQAQLPDEFQQVDLLTGLANATTMQFAPDGRIFILDRYGEVIIFDTLSQTQISAGVIPVYHEHEDGLLGIAFDPNFLDNDYIYLSYSPENVVVNRVSRFTMSGNFLDLTSEQILLEWPTSRTALWHSGGDMAFDSQGNLYISTGDNATYDNLKYSPQNESDADFSAEKSSSNTNDLRGKILRITPRSNGTYTVPAGNLYPSGTADTRPEIYVMGARNPYRIFVDKENTDWLFWGEVGPDADEPSELGPEGRDEINLTKTAGNYGWPYFSGADNAVYQIRFQGNPYYNDPANPQNESIWNTGLTELPPAREAWLDFFHKSHFAGPRYYFDPSLTDDQRFPATLDGTFFYYDFNTSRIWAVQMDAEGNIIANDRFADDVFPNTRDGFIDMEMGPDGKMYILAYGTGCCPQNAGTGKLMRIDYTGITTNGPPTVMISADKNNGSLPLTVNFSSEGTSDPNGDSPLSYAWDFNGDGTTDSTLENPSFPYTEAGNFNVRLRVDDGNGAVGVNNLIIYAGNNAPTFTFNSPPDGALIDWSDNVDFDLTVTDVEDGTIDCNEVNLSPGLGHVNHSHPEASQNGCPKTLTPVPTGHSEEGEDVFYVLNADYTDTNGLQAFDQITLHPKRKEAEFFDTQSGTTIIGNTDTTEGGIEALQVDNNSYISFSGRNLANITGVKYKIAAPTAGGTIELRVGSPTGTLLATTPVPSTGSFDIWEAVSMDFAAPTGKNDIFVVFTGTSGPEDIFNINYVEFLGAGVSEARSDIIITSPSNGWNVNQPFEVAFRTENWTVNINDTHLHYFVDGILIDRYYSYDPILIEGYGAGEHTIRLELFSADHIATGIFDEVTVNISDEVTCNETPFPDSWTVHQLEENPYTSVYTFADYDFDGDGLKDIVTGGWWYKNPGSASGNWVKNTIGDGFGNVAHVHDFDSDGDMDLLGTTGTYRNAILVWAQNDGNGNFTVFNNIPAGDTDYSEPFLAGLAGGVFNTDGPYQMAINWNGAEQTGSPVQMLTPPAKENITTETWTLVDISSDSSGEDIQAGDIDQDGDLDLFQGINWLRNNGNNQFETFDTGITYASTPDRAQLADFDRDGDLDAVVGQLGAGGSGNRAEFSWFAAPSDPTQPWVRNVLDTGITGSLSVFAVDIDFDGDKDIIVGEWLGERRLLAFENDLCDTGEFILRVLDDGGLDLEHHDGARVTDIDNDGDLDVISNGWLNHRIPRIYENTSALVEDDDEPVIDTGGGNVTRINAGGPAFIFAGNDWAADQFNNGGSTISNDTPIANTENDQLYQTERFRNGGSLIYEIPVTNGIHTVDLHFAEIYWGLPGGGSDGGTGSRVFNIDIEGQERIENYDIFVEAGGAAAAIVERFTDIDVTDENLTITLEPVTDFPKLSGIEITTPNTPEPPVTPELLAVAEADPTTGEAPLEVSFTGSNSTGDIAGYLWDFKDGKTSTEADPTNIFEAEGAYDVELTVTDAGGMTDTTTIAIVVVANGEPGGPEEPGGEDLMGVFLEQNPPKDGIARITVVNAPENMMMLGINVHDVQGRLLSAYKPVDIVVEGTNTYLVPIHILKAGLYFFEIAMNQGEPVTLKVLVRN